MVPMTSTPKCSKKRRSSVASVALIKIVRKLVERHRVVAQQAALADLVAEAVEEGDAVLVGQVHLALGDLEGRDGEGKHDEQAAGAERQALAGKFVEGADEAFDLEAAEEGRIGAPPILEADPGAVKARIDTGIDGEPIDQLASAITL